MKKDHSGCLESSRRDRLRLVSRLRGLDRCRRDRDVSINVGIETTYPIFHIFINRGHMVNA